MATFIFTNSLEDEQEPAVIDDPTVCAAEHLKPVIEEMKSPAEADEFHKRFKDMYSEGYLNEIFSLFLEQTDLILEYVAAAPELNTAKRREEAEGVFTVLLSTLMHLDEESEVERLSLLLCDTFTADTGHAELKLKILMTLYNMFQPMYSLRHPVFMKILEFAGKARQVEKLLPYLDYLDQWMEDWSLDEEAQRSLFRTLSEMMRDLGKRNRAFAYLRRALELYKAEDAAGLAAPAVAEGACLAVRDAVALPNIMQVDEILDMAPVAHLAQSSNPTHRALVQLLQILKAGGLSDLSEFRKANEAVFRDQEIDPEICVSKLRLLTLAKMAEGQSELPLDAVAEELQVSTDDVETWVVRALAEGVVDGRIDQVRRVVLVKSALQRVFTRKEWQFLDKRIEGWIGNIESLLTTLATSKQAGVGA